MSFDPQNPKLGQTRKRLVISIGKKRKRTHVLKSSSSSIDNDNQLPFRTSSSPGEVPSILCGDIPATTKRTSSLSPSTMSFAEMTSAVTTPHSDTNVQSYQSFVCDVQNRQSNRLDQKPRQFTNYDFIQDPLQHHKHKQKQQQQKRQKQQQNNQHDDDEWKNDKDLFEIPSDIILAIHSLKQRYSSATCDLNHSDPIHFVLKPMVNAAMNTLCKDSKANQVSSAILSTSFDAELQRLCSLGKLRLIQLQGLNGEEDEAIFEMQDYVKAICDIQLGQDTSIHDQRLMDVFLSCVHEFPQTFVLEKDLQRSIKKQIMTHEKDDEYLLQDKEKWIDTLIRHQLLLPRRLCTSVADHIAQEHRSYWFTLPKLGHAASLIHEGRKRMINKLKRATNKEVKRSILEQNARGGMSGPFHVRDLLARGVVTVHNTANGPFVKLV